MLAMSIMIPSVLEVTVGDVTTSVGVTCWDEEGAESGDTSLLVPMMPVSVTIQLVVSARR